MLVVVVGGIWLLCALAALVIVIPMCRMAKQADRADAAAVRAALEAGAAMEASVRAARAQPGFVTDIADAQPAPAPREDAVRPAHAPDFAELLYGAETPVSARGGQPPGG